MSTRSAIIMADGNGFRGIYCHFDGYVSGVGAMLLKHYTNPVKVAGLIALGDISFLEKKVAPSKRGHSYDTPHKGVTVAYMRDRQESGCEARTGSSVKEVESQIGHDGYVYVFDGENWWLWSDPKKLLKDAVENDS